MKPCLDCGTLSQRTRCPKCSAAQLQAKRVCRPYTYTERKRRAAAVAAHRAAHGDWCPGWGRPAHASSDLTADHTLAVAAGGREDGPLSVLCRVCNGAKQDRSAKEAG